MEIFIRFLIGSSRLVGFPSALRVGEVVEYASLTIENRLNDKPEVNNIMNIISAVSLISNLLVFRSLRTPQNSRAINAIFRLTRHLTGIILIINNIIRRPENLLSPGKPFHFTVFYTLLSRKHNFLITR